MQGDCGIEPGASELPAQLLDRELEAPGEENVPSKTRNVFETSVRRD